MKKIRPSEFRDALQVSPDRIAHLSDTELSDLMAELLRAQAHRCGSPQSEIRVNAEEKAQDGGCDAWTAKPTADDDWLGDTDTCWQLKAGVAGTPARLKGEVDKPLPRKTLEAGGSFVVVAPGSTNGKKGEEDRKATLIEEASAAGIPTEHIEVIGSDRLATWCNQHPAIAARYAGRPPGLWTLSDWLNTEVHQVTWQAPDSVNSELERLRSAIEFETGYVQHLHIYGPPGVGKTRFALELCRAAPWSPFVIYVPQASDLRLLELIGEAAADPAVRLVVVADEIQPEQLVPLRDEIARANGRICLITVGHCPTPEPARIPAFPVRPLDREAAEKIVKGWYPSMPIEHVDFIVRFADGYVRLAKLAADAVARNTSINMRELLSRHEIQAFLDRMLGPGDRRALHVVAVLSSVGWSGDVQVEGEAVARHFGLDWNDVRAKVEDFNRRFGIAPQGGRCRYISPTPLGIYLAVEAWTIFPDLLRSLPDALPTEGAKNAYYERLRSLVSNPQAREYARKELALFFRLDDFIDARAVRRWSAFSAADPDQAAANILRALEEATIEGRSHIEHDARRRAVVTLARLARRPGAFFAAAKALALLAEVENEPWGNNATGEFVKRFQIYGSGTAVPYRERLPVLDELVETDRPVLIRLAVKALEQIGDRFVYGTVSAPASDGVPEMEWQPSTWQEHFDCVVTALGFLTKLASQGSAGLEGEFVSAANRLAMMLRDGPVRSTVATLFEAIRDAYPETREPLRRMVADVVRHERKLWKELPEKEVAELDALHARFEDPSLLARLQQLVGQLGWDREEQPDIRPLARELIGSSAMLVEVWPWLTSGGAADGWRLGEALAEEDVEGQLLELAQEFDGVGSDHRVLCGYISITRKRRGDEWYDHWMKSQSQRVPRPAHLFFEVASRCGVTPLIAQCLQEILQAETVAPAIIGQFGFGRLGEELEQEPLAKLLQAMIDAGHGATTLMILESRIKSLPAEHDRWQALALELIAAPNLIHSEHMTNYYWKELAMRYIDEQPGEIAATIIRQQEDPSSGIIGFRRDSNVREVLRACVERDPEGVWLALQPLLSSEDGAYIFSGFPRGIVDQLPLAHILAWVDADPDNRGRIMARLARKDFSNDETLASRIVGTYGDRNKVGSAFFSEYWTGGWSGPTSEHWAKLAAALEEVAKRTELPKLRQWAKDAEGELKRMAERERVREEEEEIRWW